MPIYYFFIPQSTLAKPNQARLDIIFSARCQDFQPSTTPFKPMPTEKTPITPTVNTSTSIRRHQQSYKMWKTNDLKFVLEYYLQLPNGKHGTSQ